MARPAVVLAAVLSSALVLGLQHVSAQWIRGPGENVVYSVSSDFMYRFRVAVTPKSNLVYCISGTDSTLVQFNFTRTSRGIGDPLWTSPRVPGLSTKQPVLNVDSTTDKVYFIHPEDGRIYCYDASKGPNVTEPVWVSSVVCSSPNDTRDQHLQAFTANGSRLLARCNNSIVVLGVKGTPFKVYSSPNVQAFVAASDLAAPIPVFNKFTRMVTWFTNSSGSFLEIWALDGTNSRPTRPVSTIHLPAGVTPSGVNTDSTWWAAVADASAPVVHVYSPFTDKLQSSYNFKALLDPEDAMVLRVLPTPIIANKTMYGIVQGLIPSPYPWMPEQYPDKYVWWMFALNYTTPTRPTLLWVTPQQATRGPLAPQTPWATARAVFITDYQQNGTRGFDRSNGQVFFNVPANPYFKGSSQYSLARGTYKMSLPWVSPDGFFEIVQYDDWTYDLAAPEDRADISCGNIRTMLGQPFSPPPPQRNPPPPPPAVQSPSARLLCRACGGQN